MAMLWPWWVSGFSSAPVAMMVSLFVVRVMEVVHRFLVSHRVRISNMTLLLSR
jgi:hypothetical protein